MRIAGSAACLSWIPPPAVEGTFGLPFGLGIAHYDQPPPDAAPDIDALLAADAIRFANQLHAWIETGNGRIVNHGMSGCGRLGSTTVRLGSHGLTFAGVALPDLTPPPEVEEGRVHFTQTAGGHTGIAVPRRVSHPAVLAADRPGRLVHHHADPPRRQVIGGAPHRRKPVPAPRPLRPGGPAHPQKRPAAIPRLDPGIGQARHPLGRHGWPDPSGRREHRRGTVPGERHPGGGRLPAASCQRPAQG